MNQLLSLAGIEHWKPLITALLLPPVPLLLMVLVGARLLLPRRGLGWLVIIVSVLLLWFSACTATERLLAPLWLKSPPPLSAERIAGLKAEKSTQTAIVVLGGGAQPFAPDYGVSNLTATSLERLRYGAWLARRTGLPLAFVGGTGWGGPEGTGLSEAEIAARIAAEELGVPVKWTETRSRDTRQNANMGVPLLRNAGIRHIVLVTHDYHMPRSRRAFEEAAAGTVRIEPAPMGQARHENIGPLDWVPSHQGVTRVRQMLRELAGLAAGS